MNEQFFSYVENRAQSGYGAGILYKLQTDTKYSLLIAGETAPSVFGTPNSFEFDLINSPNIGKIQGKSTLEEKEVEFLLHRDNVYRLEQLKDLVLDFIYMTPDMVGWHFTGKLSYRSNDASAETLKGTYVLTPMSADESPIYNCREFIQETIVITEAIPDYITDIKTAGTSVGIVANVSDYTIACSFIDALGNVDTTHFEATLTQPVAGANSGSVLIKRKIATAGTFDGIAIITLSKASYSNATTTIAVRTLITGA